ncbi:hypothetical protein HELRODRAFT_107147 [Helobdella robusta]|uniref:HMG box domain-containing protein n=1 Tax=Helobdella robusta TaxID=6412 RepID=T1EE78_HELRO|nr:hypothetical protein HELRODRAFT_107147 [Helobdella robusta]ESN99051.1 hypothetical protein HELRODRAFT_107147 [Helobdella robusta]
MFFTPTRSQNGLLTTDSQFYPGGYFPCGFNGVVEKNQRATPKKPIIKKPLNAFMLFMKEMRQSVIEECTLKESAAINQILGRKWHALDRSEQAKYYEMAKKEKELHAQKYPGWSARDNYAMSSKKKKRRLENQDSTASSDSDSSRPIKKSDSKSFSSSAMRELSMNGGDHNHHHHPFSPLTNDFSRVNNMSITSL